VPNEPITRAKAKKLKKALSEFVRNIGVKMNLEELGVANEYEGQRLIYLIQIQVLMEAYVFDPKVSLVWSYFY
jgi:alcohol dehydrogenase class IV